MDLPVTFTIKGYSFNARFLGHDVCRKGCANYRPVPGAKRWLCVFDVYKMDQIDYLYLTTRHWDFHPYILGESNSGIYCVGILRHSVDCKTEYPGIMKSLARRRFAAIIKKF